MQPPIPVLFVHHRSELGGAPESLSYLIRELDRGRFEPHVYCPPGPAAELFSQAGAKVHTGPVAGFTHIWASTYRGRRWLLFLRELGLLPHHVLRFRRTLRRQTLEQLSPARHQSAPHRSATRQTESHFAPPLNSFDAPKCQKIHML